MTPRVETTDPDGVDFGWVMQVTFVTTILVGAPLVAVLSLGATLPDWSSRALFAVRVGAVIWFLTAVVVYSYARLYRDPDGAGEAGTEESGDQDAAGRTDPVEE